MPHSADTVENFIKPSAYDSSADTLAHIGRVRELMAATVERLTKRANVHDASKLESPEKEAFDRLTPRLKGLTYGSEEYRASLAELQIPLRHHYEHNSHHPEHYCWHCPICGSAFSASQAPIAAFCSGVDGDDHRFCPKCCPGSVIWEAELDYKPSAGVAGMSLLDLLEMLCDWKAAGERHADGSMERSLKLNKERFGVSDQLQSVLSATAKEMGWV